ncbi:MULTISPECIES: hypothetical protein [Pseudonocardia]|nr:MULTISPECIES: hypothetical protein [Pseudonocardia]
MLHAQVVWRELRKRELTEPQTAEAREWTDTHLQVVRTLEERTDAGNALADYVDDLGDWDPEGLGGRIDAWRSAAGGETR